MNQFPFRRQAAAHHAIRWSFLLAICAIGRPISAADEELTPIPIAELNRTADVDFHREIMPLLRRSCLACHNATDAESGLALESREAILKGGSEGPAIVPGNGAESLLLQVAAAQREPAMPPADNAAGAKPLTSEELALLKLWIDQGAKIESSSASKAIAWRPLPGNVNPILSAVVDAEGRWTASGRGNRLFVHHAPSGRLVQELVDPTVTTGQAAHFDLIQSLCFDPQAERIASGGYQSIKIWRRQPERLLAELSAGKDVTAFAANHEHTRAAVATSVGEIRLFDLTAKSPLGLLSGHQGIVRDVRFSADGQLLVSGGADGTIRIWQIATLQEVRQIKTPAEVLALELPNAEQLLAAGSDNILRLWSMAAPSEGEATAVREYRGHAGPIHSVAFSPANGGVVVTGSNDGTVRMWGFEQANELRAIQHGSPVTMTDVSPDGNRIVSAGVGPGIKLWNATNGELVADIQRDARLEQQMAREQQEVSLATGEVNATQGRMGEIEKQITAQQEGVNKAKEALASSETAIGEQQKAVEAATQEKVAAENVVKVAELAVADGVRLAEAAQQQQQAAKERWDMLLAELTKARQTIGEAAPKSLEALAALLSATDQTVQQTRQQQEQAYTALTAKLDEVKSATQPALEQSKKMLEEAAKKHDETQKAMQAAQKAKEDAMVNLQQAEKDVARSQEELAVKQTEKENWARLAETHESSRKELETSWANLVLENTRVVFSSDSRDLLVGDTQHRVGRYDAETGAQLSVFERLTSAVVGLAAGNLTDNLPSIGLGSDGQILVWQAERTWELERTIGGLDQPGPLQDRVLCLDISHDGQFLAAGSGQPSRSGPIAIYSLESGELVRAIPEAHSDTVYGVQFSRDGKFLASSAADRMARVFKVETGEVVRTMEGHTHHVLDVAWQANGKLLATAGADNVIKVWDFETGEQRRTIAGINKEVTSIRFVGITQQTLSSSGDTNARLHDTSNGNVVRTWNSAGDYLYTSSTTDDGKRVFVGGSQGVLRIFDGESGSPIREIR